MRSEPKIRKKLFANAPLPLPGTRVCVIVPVRNEANNLRQTLEALRLQADGDNNPLNFSIYEVLVLVNNSTDGSYQIVLNYKEEFPAFRLMVDEVYLPKRIAHIGTVRRALMDEACRRMTLSGDGSAIIASIDGDTQADAQWVYYIMDEMGRGNDAVGGSIVANGHAGNAHQHYVRDITYRCLLTQAESVLDPQENDPLPRHFQYFGANMAVTCKMYQQAGRLPQVSCLEDKAFHQALIRHDARIRKSLKVKVFTSARLDGRVDIGFSEQLKKWAGEEEANIPQVVEDVEGSLADFKVRGRLRRFWQNFKVAHMIQHRKLAVIANTLQIEPGWLESELKSAVYFGELWERINQKLKEEGLQLQTRYQPVLEAIEKLRNFLKDTEAASFRTDEAYQLRRTG